MKRLIARRLASAPRDLFLLTLGLVVFNQTTFARTLHVPNDAATLQVAIDVAAIGDQILVSPGTYTGPGNKNLTLGDKDLVIRSEGGPQVTILDLQGSGRAFVLFGPNTRSALVEGFTIENGDGSQEPTGGGGMIIGGGSPTIRRCVFRNNQASGNFNGGGGGGLACHGSSALIEDCEFIQNTTVRAPGAVGGAIASHGSALEIRGCRFVQNRVLGSGGSGGGIYAHQFRGKYNTIIEDCEFIGNEGQEGGGAWIVGGRLARCTFENNRADASAGLFLTQSEMVDSRIAGNIAVRAGGGVQADLTRIANCVITGNKAAQGGGLALFSSTSLEQCLIADNIADWGGGILQRGVWQSSIQRCTVVRNRALQGSGIAYAHRLVTQRLEATIIANGIGGAAIECTNPEPIVVICTDIFGNEGGDWTSCVEGMQTRDGNFSADPRFCGSGSGKEEFALSASSPCLPGNHPHGSNCGIIGSEGEGCAALAVEATTWGTIKNRYQK